MPRFCMLSIIFIRKDSNWNKSLWINRVLERPGGKVVEAADLVKPDSNLAGGLRGMLDLSLSSLFPVTSVLLSK